MDGKREYAHETKDGQGKSGSAQEGDGYLRWEVCGQMLVAHGHS